MTTDYKKPTLYATTKIRIADLEKLRLASRLSGETMMDILGRTIQAELKHQQKNSGLAKDVALAVGDKAKEAVK